MHSAAALWIQLLLYLCATQDYLLPCINVECMWIFMNANLLKSKVVTAIPGFCKMSRFSLASSSFQGICWTTGMKSPLLTFFCLLTNIDFSGEDCTPLLEAYCCPKSDFLRYFLVQNTSKPITGLFLFFFSCPTDISNCSAPVCCLLLLFFL